MTQFLRLSLHSMPRSRLHSCQNISSEPLNTAPLSFLWWAALVKGWHNSEDWLCYAFRLRSGFYHLGESQSKHTYHRSEAGSWQRATRPESNRRYGPDSLRLVFWIKKQWEAQAFSGCSDWYFDNISRKSTKQNGNNTGCFQTGFPNTPAL